MFVCVCKSPVQQGYWGVAVVSEKSPFKWSFCTPTIARPPFSCFLFHPYSIFSLPGGFMYSIYIVFYIIPKRAAMIL